MVEVSVCVMSYNFEKYISQTLNSVLSQNTDFDFEIIVCDDGSNDNTPLILKEYQNKYPDLIKLVLLSENTKGKLTVIKALEKASGKYIALLEGDDFWCNDNKLQMQFDYMEKHPDMSAVVTHLNSVNENGEEIKMPKHWQSNIDKDVFSIKDFERHPISPFVQSLFYRNKSIYFDTIRSWCRMDNCVQAMLLYDGNIGILSDVTATYRIVRFKGNNFSSKPIYAKAQVLFDNAMLIKKYFGDKINMDYLIEGYLADLLLFGYKHLSVEQKEYYKNLSIKRKIGLVVRAINESIIQRFINIIVRA